MSNTNTNNPNNEVPMVPQIQGFVNSHDFVTVEIKHPETGNIIKGSEMVPRGLEMLSHETWLKDNFLAQMLGLVVGTNVRVTERGTEIRDLYLSKVQGKAINPRTGKPYRWCKIGQIFSKMRQDTETNQMKVMVWVQIGNKPWVKAEKAPDEPQEPQSEEQKAEAATDAIDSL